MSKSKIFVSFVNRTCSAFRNYETDSELLAFLKEGAHNVYMIAVEDGNVVYEYHRGKSPVINNIKDYNRERGFIRKANARDYKRIKYAFDSRLINCDVNKFDAMMKQAETEGVI